MIGDDNWYDYLKLWAVFFAKIGYLGFVVMIDECVNLYKIANRQSRENNYEKILSMFNDTLQGKAQHLMLLLGGTPRFLEDERRGLYSYDALKSRLCDDRFSAGGYVDMLSPVIRLKRLSDDELLALVQRMARLHGEYYGWQVRLSDAELEDFVSLCLARAGADTDTKERAYALTKEFLARFTARHGTVLCRELLGVDVGTTEGLNRARTEGMFKTLCPNFVRCAAELLEEML